MEEKQLISFAIMNVNESNNVDQFDHFVPFVKEALLRAGVETISANELKGKIEEYFKIQLPISVVNTILRRKLLPKHYIKIKEKTFVPDYEKLSDSNFQEIKQNMMGKHEKLIRDIIDYGKQKYDLEIEMDQVEKALETFLDTHQLALLDSSLNPSSTTKNIKSGDKKEGHIEYIISKFIEHAYVSGLVSFDYIIDIVKGTMLTNALYYKEDITTLNMKFKSTEVFFDSTFLIYALGHAGDARQEPCIELIEMLRTNGAILKVFRHNIEEMIGILEYCKNNLTRRIHDPHGTINNFLDKRYSPTEIDRIIYGIENELKDRFRINLVESVDYDNYDHVISHEELQNHLKQNMTYRNENARDRDVQSMSAIMRLRKGVKPYHVEKCRAIFVTNNYTLARIVKEHFFDEENPKRIPPVLHDSILTNLMWLKSPSKAPELPRKRVIAETFAASQPPEHLWNRYLETVKIYERTKKITEEDIVFLQYSQAARELVMDLTMGDEDIVSIGTIEEILSERENREQQKIDDLRKVEGQKIEVLEKQLKQAEEQAAATTRFQEKHVTSLAESKAKLTTNMIFVTLAIIIGLSIYLSSFNWLKDNYPIISNGIIIFLVVAPTIMGLFNINLLPWRKKVNSYFQNKYAQRIKNKYYESAG